MVIDNDPRKKAKKVVSRFKRLLPIIWIHEKKVGIPNSRNRAFFNCHTKYLAFIDDDCLLSPDWVSQAFKSISTHPKESFVIGETKLQNPNNIIAKVQFEIYAEWFKQNINPKNNSINSQALDTKNIIFDLKKINPLRFDHQFKIFEDIDFGLQLKQKKLVGIYNPKMLIFHQEEENLLKAIKKNYHRGQFKYLLNQKWGNFDNYSPSLNMKQLFHHPIKFFFNLSFSWGFNHAVKNLIAIVNNLDNSANGQRAKKVAEFLKFHGYNVTLINSQKLFDKIVNHSKYFFVLGTKYFLYRLFRFLKYRFHQKLNSELFYKMILLRGEVLKKYLIQIKAKIVICQYPEDLACLIKPNGYKTIYDSPTIYSQEITLSQQYNSRIQNKITDLENKVFQESDIISFHWYSFFKLAQKLGIAISHPLILNWGCQPLCSKPARYSLQPKIIYLGNLNSDWINPKLLLQIQNTSSIPVHIFSYESPSFSNLKTKGFLSDLNQLNQYQFGLITISNDQLRNHGFSAKYLNYLELGLPILCPDWRQDKLLKPATIYYNEKNFNQKIRQYTNPRLWRKKHLAALKLSQQLTWEKNLTPLLKKISQLLTHD